MTNFLLALSLAFSCASLYFSLKAIRLAREAQEYADRILNPLGY